MCTHIHREKNAQAFASMCLRPFGEPKGEKVENHYGEDCLDLGLSKIDPGISLHMAALSLLQGRSTGRHRLDEGQGEPAQLRKPKIRDSLSILFSVSCSEMGEEA